VAQQVGKVAYEASDIGRLRRERLAPREGKKLLGEPRAPVGRRAGGAEPGESRAIVRHRALHEIEVGLDDLEDVVEVVRHAAGELARRLHLLALAQRRLVAQLFGDVDAAHHRSAARHLAARDLVVASVVARTRRHLAVGRLGAKLQRLEQRAHGRRSVGQKLIARQCRVPGGIPPRQAQKGFVPCRDPAVGVDHEDRILQALERGLQQVRAIGKRQLRGLQASGAADDDVHADEQAQEGAGQQQETGDIGLVLLRAQHGQASGQQQPLPFDERFGDLADLVAGNLARPGALLRESVVAAVELVGADGAVDLLELLVGRRPELAHLPRRVGIADGSSLELAQPCLDAQARPLVWFEVARLAAQQIGALADLAVLQGDHGLAHQRQDLVAADHQALLARRGVRMGDGEQRGRADQHGNRQPDDHARRARRAGDATHRLPGPAAWGRSPPLAFLRPLAAISVPRRQAAWQAPGSG
jgi:hypothetical protein